MRGAWPVLVAVALVAGCDEGIAVERLHHAVCFPITDRAHGGVACLDCHTAVPQVALTGAEVTCASDSVDCTRCHACAAHTSVLGFACVNRRCYECHRPATGAAPLTGRGEEP